jgi:threonine dehydratase
VAWPGEHVARTIADGTRTSALGARTFAHLSALLDRIVTVDEDEIGAAVRLIAEECRLVAEPSGALAAAAMRFRAGEAGLNGVDGPVVGVISGGNVDPEQYRHYLETPVPAAR